MLAESLWLATRLIISIGLELATTATIRVNQRLMLLGFIVPIQWAVPELVTRARNVAVVGKGKMSCKRILLDFS
jgi:hypothetical protein